MSSIYEKNPEISIIIPVYNCEKFLDTCIKSILNQSFKDFEIICVDDHSNDTSLEILQNFAEHDARITVIVQKENKGPAPARNIGIQRARGNYCIFCDSDDAYPPYALERLLHTAKSKNVSVCGGNIIFMDHDMQYIRGVDACVACTQFFETAVVSLSLYSPLWFPIYHQRYLIARDLLCSKNIEYPDLRLGEDAPFLAHVLCSADKIAVIPDVVYIYRCPFKHKASSQSIDKISDYMKHISMIYDMYVKYDHINIANFFLMQTLENLSHFRTLLTLARISNNQRKSSASFING